MTGAYGTGSLEVSGRRRSVKVDWNACQSSKGTTPSDWRSDKPECAYPVASGDHYM